MGIELGFGAQDVIRALGEFRGVRRRFETVGCATGVTVIDDYAHHPAEVSAVMAAAGEIADGRIVVVFQPHRYSRTRTFAPDFAGSLSSADVVVVTDVYAAGEDPEPGVSGQLIVDSLETRGGKVLYVQNRAELARSVIPLLEEGDTLITMGAGDVTQCAREILELLEE
jgi:UDP-N-acetylmuramate--alanine ligase